MIHATLHQLKVFETTARHSSFTRAAEELEITQPTVSSQIKQLTKAVGLPLFEQIGKRLYLTDAGGELLQTCQEIFARLENFEMMIADFKGKKQGKLKLAAITTTKYFIPRLLGHFCQIHPDIDVALQVINHEQIQQRMLQNRDDLYVLSQCPEGIPLAAEPFLDNPLVVVAHHQHPLAGQRNLPLTALANEPFIMREFGSGTRQAIEQLLASQGVEVQVRLELGSNEAIKQAIVGGMGISVLSQHCLVGMELSPELTVLDVEQFPIQRQWYVAHLASKQLSVIAQTFRDYLLAKSQGIQVQLIAS
ncbi:MAG: LysR substrate-binding domain-containing protein [Spirulinaceae cyanobacterium]